MQIIDLHTHHANNGGHIRIANIFAQDFDGNDLPFWFSIGLHPWHIGKEDFEHCMRNIELAATQKTMLAIGECGLDRAIEADFATQSRYFEHQVSIAKTHDKPLIIHCVRAYNELIHIRKSVKNAPPWIIHDYQAKTDITKQLLEHDFYFSVGERLLKNPMKQDYLKTIPLNRLFLETDGRDVTIDDIYTLAAQILKIPNNELVEIIAKNFNSLFGLTKTQLPE